MKVTIGLLVTLAILAAIAAAQPVEEQETIFERTFKELHSIPPVSLANYKSYANIQTLWIEQKLDNFDELNEETWQMRYLSNDEFYEEGGPLFIFVGGEGAVNADYISGGHLNDMAKEHHGYLFFTEHRYYGESRPTSDLSNENLKYLNVRQALADLAHFIRTMKATIPGATNSKVILTGGSYAGSMVTWFKKLYPELATGSWASSAPLFAKVNFVEYMEVTGQSIRLVGGDTCYNRIKNGIAEMEYMFDTRRGATVKAMLNLCNNFDESNDLDIWTLFSLISDSFAGEVQYHGYVGDIRRACNTIMEGEDDLDGVSKYLVSKFRSYYYCKDSSYKTSLSTILSSGYTNNIMRQWFYQTCNEFGWYSTSGSSEQPFGTNFPVHLYTTMCYDAYGEQFTNEFIYKQVNETNEFFGGLNPEVENVYMTHGQLDPWRAMGIQDEEQATIIPMHSHCSDFGSISYYDTPELRASKEKLAQLVREWVGESAEKK